MQITNISKILIFSTVFLFKAHHKAYLFNLKKIKLLKQFLNFIHRGLRNPQVHIQHNLSSEQAIISPSHTLMKL